MQLNFAKQKRYSTLAVSIELNEFDALVRNGNGKTRLITLKIRMTNIITIMMMMVTMMM